MGPFRYGPCKLAQKIGATDHTGYGIINATGDLWRAQRKAGLKFFAGANLDALVEEVLPAVYAQTQLKLTEHANTGAVVDMQKVFLDMTTAVVGQMAYDASVHSDSGLTDQTD